MGYKESSPAESLAAIVEPSATTAATVVFKSDSSLIPRTPTSLYDPISITPEFLHVLFEISYLERDELTQLINFQYVCQKMHLRSISQTSFTNQSRFLARKSRQKCPLLLELCNSIFFFFVENIKKKEAGHRTIIELFYA